MLAYLHIKANNLLVKLGVNHNRTKRAYLNITGSFLIKGLSILISFILVPLTLDYIDPIRYGIWITLSSVVNWFGFFDIGLTNGLRNNFAQALANNKHELAKIYVSTTYAYLLIIITIVYLVFIFVNPYLNYNKILNVNIDLNSELSLIALIVFTFFCFRFILKIITTILSADQRLAKAETFDLIGKILTLITIFILIKTTSGSLLYLSIALSSIPVFVLFISSIWFFNGKYKPYRPSLKSIQFKYSSSLVNLGIKFFIIQLAGLLLYQTNNIIIAQLFGVSNVTPYNIAFKLFSLITLGFSIISTPFWSAFTEAYTIYDFRWIQSSVRNLFKIWILFSIFGLLLLFSSAYIYNYWIGNKIDIPFELSLIVCMNALIFSFSNIFSIFLNGIGKLKLQLVVSITIALINIPLSLLLGKLIGISGVLLTNTILGLISISIFPIQYRKIVSGKAKGLWNQ